MMSLNLSLPKQMYSQCSNLTRLSDDTFMKYNTATIKDFVEINDNGEVSISTL